MEMENKLSHFNMGNIETNKIIFLATIRQAYGINKEDLEQVLSGYKFLFDSETGGYIRVAFYDTGTQINTEIIGDYADEVMSVYKEFAGRFSDN
jgi:hypothetical protein